jgi:hypothetical protein
MAVAVRLAPAALFFGDAAGSTTSTENAPETVSKRGAVERVEKRVDGRVSVAEPQSHLVDVMVNGSTEERLRDEQSEVWNPANGEGGNY